VFDEGFRCENLEDLGLVDNELKLECKLTPKLIYVIIENEKKIEIEWKPNITSSDVFEELIKKGYEGRYKFTFNDINKAWKCGSTVHAKKVIPCKDGYKIIIKMLTGRELTIHDCHDQMIITELKEYIEVHEGIPIDQQRLIFAGKQLEAGKSLVDYNIIANSSVTLVLRLRGGMMHPSSGRSHGFGQITEKDGQIHDFFH
jgi:ubiquitin